MLQPYSPLVGEPLASLLCVACFLPSFLSFFFSALARLDAATTPTPFSVQKSFRYESLKRKLLDLVWVGLVGGGKFERS